MSVRIAYYADDFTGATDTLATAAQAGLRTLLFLRVPAGVPLDDLDCIGFAGASRSMTPASMTNELRPVAEWFATLRPPVIHYKTCSTFDSSPEIGNIAVAVRTLQERVDGNFVPIVGGQPNIGRYCVFGHLFAATEIGGPILRIDRHPMSRHPVTPMTESDLRLHLERQGLSNVAVVSYPNYEAASSELERILDVAIETSRPLLFDVTRVSDLATIGRLIWRAVQARTVIAVGPSGVTQALCAYWRETGDLNVSTDVPGLGAAEGPVFVMAGSLSPVTRRQITSATMFARLPVDATLLARRDPKYLAGLVHEAARLLGAGRCVVAHTAPLDDGTRHAQALPGIEIAKATGEFVRRLLATVRLRRIGIAGGDTSSWVLRALDIWGLSFAGHLAPGVALCRAHSADSSLDGLEIMLKGGQMGPPDLLSRLQQGV